LGPNGKRNCNINLAVPTRVRFPAAPPKYKRVEVMNLKVIIEMTETAKDLHDIDIEVEGIEVDDLPNLFDYLTPRIAMRHKDKKLKRIKVVE